MLLAAIAVPFLVPLILAPHVLFYYDITPKVTVMLLGTAALLAFTSFSLDYIRAFVGTRYGRLYAAAAGASILVAILTTVGAVHPLLSWNGSNWRRYGALTECATILAAFLIAAYVFRQELRIRAIMRGIYISGLIASVYGIAQYFGWDPLLPSSAYEAGEGVFKIVRPPGPLGHADYFAAFLLWPAFLGLGAWRDERASVWRVLAVCSSAAGMIAIVLSGSRGALLALAAGLCVLFARSRPRFGVVAVSAALAGIALSLLYVSPAGERLRARAHWIGEERTGGARILLWRDSLAMAATRPLRGFGPENFVAEFPRFQSVDLARAYPDFFHESPHNVFLDEQVAEGVGGLLALVAIAAIGLTAGAAGGPPYLLAAFVATLVSHQFIVFTAPTAFYFYLGAGLLVASGERIPSRSLAANPRWTAWLRPSLAICNLAAAIFLIGAAYRLLSADYSLATVDRRLDAGDPRGAADAYRRALQHSATGVSADLHFARRWAAVAAQFSDVPSRLYYSQIAAGAATLAAHSPEQQQNAWYNLAVLTASRNDAAGVEYALRSAIALGTNWYKPHWALARLLASEQRGQEAIGEAALARKLNAHKDSEVTVTLGTLSGSRVSPK